MVGEGEPGSVVQLFPKLLVASGHFHFLDFVSGDLAATSAEIVVGVELEGVHAAFGALVEGELLDEVVEGLGTVLKERQPV